MWWTKVKECLKRVKKGLLLGLLVLLVVDVLWVGSAGLTRYLFTEASYDKPFFTTYFKTSLFSIYLVAFVFWRPWQRACGCGFKKRRKQLQAAETEGHRSHDHEGEGLGEGVANGEIGRSYDHERAESGEGVANGEVRSHDHEGAGPGEDVANGEIGRSHDSEEAGSGEGVANGEVRSHDHEGPGPGEGVVNGVTGRVVRESKEEVGGSKEESEAGSEESGVRTGKGSEARKDIVTWSNGSTSEVKFAVAGDPTSSHTSECTAEVEGDATHPSEQQLLSERPRHKLFRPQGSLDKCPLPRSVGSEVCLLGPSEFRPLCCNTSDPRELEGRGEDIITPCSERCCKVRFSKVIEVRETRGKGSSGSFRQFNKIRDCERRRCARKLSGGILPVKKVVVLSLVFGLLWFFANYLYALALDKTNVAVVNTLSATSGVFVMVLAGIPRLGTTEGDKFTIPRCLVTLFSVSGAVLVALSPSGKDDDDSGSQEHHKLSNSVAGALFSLAGAVLYAVYLVLLRKMVKDPEALEIPMFFGFVGLFDVVLLSPLLVLWHFTKLEVLELPSSEVWTLLLVNGFVGTVLSELLWLWGVFLTSPLLGTLALSLVTPFSITYSIVIGKATFSWMFLLGAVIIVLGFVGVAILEQLGAWDPIWAKLKQYLRTDTVSSPTTFAPESQHLLSDSHSLLN